MANEFIARKGLVSSGSVNVSGSVTASFFKGDGSQLTNLPAAAVLSSSVSIDTYTFTGNGSTQNYILSQSYDVSSLFVSVEGLSQTNIQDYTLTGATLSFVSAPPASSNILVKALLNVTQNMTGSFSGSFFGILASASYATTASYAERAGGLGGVISSSTQFKTLTDPFTGSFTGSHTGTFPYSGLTGTPTLVSSSTQIDYNSITNKLSGVISSSAQFNALTNTSATSASFVTSTIGLGAPTVINSTNGSGLVLQGKGNSQTAELRIVANGGAWLDSINTAYFQITSSTGNNASFMGGKYGADAPFDRLQFNTKYLQISNNGYASSPVPSYVLQVLNTTSSVVPVVGILGNSTQTSNYLDITTSGSTAGNILSVKGTGLVTIGSNLSVGTSVTASAFTGSFTGSAKFNVAPIILVVDNHAFEGNGVTTNYTLSSSYDPAVLTVSVEGLLQTQTTDYTLSGTTLSFIATPPTSSNIFVKAFRLALV